MAFAISRRWVASASAAVLALSALPGYSQAEDKLHIYVVPGAYADSVPAAAEQDKAQGINVKVVEFTNCDDAICRSEFR